VFIIIYVQMSKTTIFDPSLAADIDPPG
jgi:hypothetical protein